MEYRDKISENEMAILRKEWKLAGLQVEEEADTILLYAVDRAKDDPIYPAAYTWMDGQWRLLNPGFITAIIRTQLIDKTQEIYKWVNRHTHTSGVSGPTVPRSLSVQMVSAHELSEDDTAS